MSKKETKNIQELVRKPELYLGIATLIVAGIFIAKVAYNPVVKKAIKPTPTSSLTNNIEPKQVVVQKIEVKKSIKQITKFADTGTIKVQAKAGDSFWKIAEQVCGNGVLGDMVREQNGYEKASLQPGDIVTVSCN